MSKRRGQNHSTNGIGCLLLLGAIVVFVGVVGQLYWAGQSPENLEVSVDLLTRPLLTGPAAVVGYVVGWGLVIWMVMKVFRAGRRG
jgi:hypothetical protein